MGAAHKMSWGSTAGTATVTAGSNQILNTANGLAINAKIGDYTRMCYNSLEVCRFNGLGIDLSSGNLLVLGGTPTVAGMGSYAYVCGTNTGNEYNVPAGLGHNFRVSTSIYAKINATGIDLSPQSANALTFGPGGKVIFGSGGSSTAANREIVGTSTGVDYNVPTNLAHTFRANNVSQGTWDGINGVAVISAVNSSTLKLNPGGGYAASDYAILAVSGTGNVHNVPTNLAHIFRVNNGATVSIGLDLWVGSAAKNTTDTTGFIYLTTSAGAPTGVPSGHSGQVACHYDTTNNRFYVYNGAWKSVVLA